MMAAEEDGEVVTFGDGNADEDGDDDDDMLDLFSFGAETATTVTSTGTNSAASGDINSNRSNSGGSAADAMKSVMPLPPSSRDRHGNRGDGDDHSTGSADSFIELLEQRQEETTVLGSSNMIKNFQKGAEESSSQTNNNGQNGIDDNDSDMQEILDWLDDDDEKNGGTVPIVDDNEEEELIFVEPPRPPSLAESVPKPVPPPPPPKEYDTLEEAVKAHDSSLSQIRRRLEKDKFVVQPHVRPWLWAKVICNKTLEETLQSSIADSFQQWEEKWRENENSILSQVSLKVDGASDTEVDRNNGRESKSAKTQEQQNLSNQARKRDWLEEQSKVLAPRIAQVSEKGDVQQHQADLFALLMNHEGSRTIVEEIGDNAEKDSATLLWKDQLLAPIACAILSAGVPKIAAAVMLSQIISKFMPIVSLSTKEREAAGEILHEQFYLLCEYHIPLLVLHLDKYIPGWHRWPPKGWLPQSWLVSHLAGEADGGPMMNPRLLLSLWDLVLTSSNNSLRFFLVMALLDHHAETLLLLTNADLEKELRRVFSFSFSSKTSDEEFLPIAEGDITVDQAYTCLRKWSDQAMALWEETPSSVTHKLKRLEDEAVSNSLLARQKAKEERLRLKQEAEAKAHQEALEAEQERRADEARLRLTRARLVAFYRQHNPGNENNIDKIMSSYEGRYDVLDAKLKQKYGVSFNPALKPKPVSLNKANNKILSTMNSGFGARRTFGKRKEDQEFLLENIKQKNSVVEVTAREVLPIICWSKESNQIKIQKLKRRSKLESDGSQGLPLKFYLIDSRPENSAHEQGKIPTSVSLTPEQLAGTDSIRAQEDMFESLRGSVHICVMGEGYSALPSLYGHKVTKGLAEFIKEDDYRVNRCALFFLTRGFPFVSILEGGFAAAHAYLCRDGPQVHLRAQDVLTDYDVETSIFAQFERLNNSSGREKAQRSLQNIFDSGITALTKSTMRFETLSSEVASTDAQTQQQGDQGNVVRRFFGGVKEESLEENIATSTEKEDNIVEQQLEQNESNIRPPNSRPQQPARNPFARFGNLGSSNHSRTAETKGSGMANHFAGFNQFRKKTFARMKNGEPKESSQSPMVDPVQKLAEAPSEISQRAVDLDGKPEKPQNAALGSIHRAPATEEESPRNNDLPFSAQVTKV